jgi:hypothetical protein
VGTLLRLSSEASVRHDAEDLDTEDREEVERAELGGEYKGIVTEVESSFDGSVGFPSFEENG